MKPAYVAGLGFWAPGLDGPAALVDGARPAEGSRARSDGASEPLCDLLPPRLARRASLLTRMMLEVASQAGTQASLDLSQVPTVFATAHGEVATMYLLLEMLHEGEGDLSPTRFHNSVYNTASGYFSIAAGNRAFTTTIAAGDQTVALALVEAFCLLGSGSASVLVVFGDEPIPLPFLREPGAAPLASAICLTTQRPPYDLGVLAMPRRAAVASLPPLPAAYHSNPSGPSLALVRALAQGRRGALQLAAGPQGWLIDLLPSPENP